MRSRQSLRKMADTVVGYVLLAAGAVMLVTPGPGIVTIVAGLAILARHYHWAERVKAAIVSRIRDAGTRLKARRVAQRHSPAPMTAPDDPLEEYDAA